eukprot:TRINITY_DN1341_c0_g1_i16.p1 TRINITY_DN1341_c0_g1~~TRINITY_DN1341_c0_g1_i16.p1  ORF type:complete len:520 (+),score=46.82 TRINITY_DN1341_c0_g1_i16:54-1613(+)
MASVKWKAAVIILSMLLMWSVLDRDKCTVRPLMTARFGGGGGGGEVVQTEEVVQTTEVSEPSNEPQLLSDMVFEYPNTTKQLKVNAWESNGMTSEVFNVYEGYCHGGRPIYEDVKQSEALDICAGDQLCQAVYCGSSTCTLLSPTCQLVQEDGNPKQGMVYVILERTPQKTHLWEILTEQMKTGITKRELQKNKREAPASKVTYLKQVPKSLWNEKKAAWQKPVKRTRRDRPYIELTEMEKRGMDWLTSVDPVHKIVIFRVLKVLSTNMFRLYDRMIGHKDIILDTEGKIGTWGLNEIEGFRERIRFGGLPLETANEILNDPSWKKVVFFRDPAERLLSCWKDKFLDGPLNGLFRKYRKSKNSTIVSFPEFVDFVDREEDAPMGHGIRVNGHYKSQVLLSNIFRFLPLFDFIGWGNSNHTQQMLEKYGLWEEYGAKSWPYGFMRSNDGHSTGAKSSFEDYYTPELLKRAKHAYAIDYKFFEMMGLEKDGPPITGDNMIPFHANCFRRNCWPGEPDSRWL